MSHVVTRYGERQSLYGIPHHAYLDWNGVFCQACPPAVTRSPTVTGRLAPLRLAWSNPAGGSRQSPEREWLARFEAGILPVDKVKAAVVTRAAGRFVISKSKGAERTVVGGKADPNRDPVLVALFLHRKHFGR